MKKLLAVFILAFLFSGCLTPVQKLGCCVKENVTAGQGCVLLNMTDWEFYDYTSDTMGDCDDPDQNLSGLCNVSIDGEYYLIPICTDDTLTECLMPDCKVMVCGDFVFTPAVAPGFSGIEDASTSVPPNVGDAKAQMFYKAQCRFLDMDEKLRRIMKNSNSLINVFRMGVGGSFDEYDQYKYLFPLSDEFCGLTSTFSGAGVDRYMNYLQPSYESFLPGDMGTDCLGEGDIPPPFEFTDPSTATKKYTTTIGADGDTISYEWSPLYVDSGSYAYKYYATLVKMSTPKYDGECSYYTFNVNDGAGLHKELDKPFYKRMLSIVYSDYIYGLVPGAETTRAPFECTGGSGDCYSGFCDVQFYNRGVLVDVNGDEVIADCNVVVDEGNHQRVVCAPTKGVYFFGDPEDPPTMDYARVTFVPWQLPIKTTSYAQGDMIEGGDDPLGECSDGMGDYHRCRLRDNWDFMLLATAPYTFQYKEDESYVGRERTLSLMPRNVEFAVVEEKDCDDYPDSTSTDKVSCSVVQAAPSFDYTPPLGSIVFFGKGKDDGLVTFWEDTVIGYAVSDPSDFEDIFFVENCGLSMENIAMPEPPEDPDEIDECIVMCESFCEPFVSVGDQCRLYCNNDPFVQNPPCGNLSLQNDPGDPVVNTKDFMRIKLPDDPAEHQWYWSSMMQPFTPLFEQRMDDIAYTDFTDGCGKRVDDGDLILSTIPWVLAYTKADVLTWDSYSRISPGYHLSFGPQALKERNVYDLETLGELGTSSCDLRYGTTKKVKGDYHAYWVLYPKYIYLFKYDESSNTIGNCKINSGTLLPEVKTFGWCEPCTFSTLAYQKVQTLDEPYYPAYITDLNTSETEELCKIERETDVEWSGFTDYVVTNSDNLVCKDYPVDGLSEYGGAVQELISSSQTGCDYNIVGGPRSVPEASVLKDRLISYLKSGVMPVLDLDDDSNWNRTSSLTTSLYNFDFQEYDFQRTFGSSGAVIVITKWVDEGTAEDEAVRDEIAGRATALRGRCYGCLNAVGIRSSSNQSFKNALDSLVKYDPRLAMGIDVIAFDYEVSDHTYQSEDAVNRTKEVVDDIVEYGRFSLQNCSKPSIVVPFNVESDDGTWSGEDYELLFTEVVKAQDEFVHAGIIGLIYSPARSYHESLTIDHPFIPGKKITLIPENKRGIVDVDPADSVGDHTEKFCALERAMNWLTSGPVTATFNKVVAVPYVNCTKCTSMEKAAGLCDLECGDGVECILPLGESPGDYKCPDNAVPEPCKLCNETGETYICTYKYVNGTTEVREFDSSEIVSDVYLDVIGGLNKPDMCCLYDENLGYKYSFMKTVTSSTFNRPVAFSESGDPYQDCGTSNPLQEIEGSTICGVEVPNQQYDVECVPG